MADVINDILKAALLYETYDITPEDKSYLKEYRDVLKKKSFRTLHSEFRNAFHVCDEKKAESLLKKALKKKPIEEVAKILLLLIEETERAAYGPAVFKMGIKTWVLSYVFKDYELLRYLYHEVLEKKLVPQYKKKIAVAVLEPDLHEYGALYGQIVLELAGFRVINLGYNLSARKVLKAVKEKKIDVLVLTSILSDPYDNMEYVIKRLKDKKTKVVIAGTMPFEIVKKIGADGYINCLSVGPKVLKHLLKIKKYTREEVPVLHD